MDPKDDQQAIDEMLPILDNTIAGMMGLNRRRVLAQWHGGAANLRRKLEAAYRDLMIGPPDPPPVSE